MLLFHGTTIENAEKIQKEGFGYNKKVWDCSLAETYFFTEDFFWEESSADDFSEMWNFAVTETLDQARIALAVENPKDYRGAVLVFDTELMKNGSDIQADYSCIGMEDMAVALCDPDMKGLVAVIHSNHDERESRPFWLASLQQREFFCMPELSIFNQTIVETLADTDFCEVLDELRLCDENKTTWINKNYLTQDHFPEELEEAV